MTTENRRERGGRWWPARFSWLWLLSASAMFAGLLEPMRRGLLLVGLRPVDGRAFGISMLEQSVLCLCSIWTGMISNRGSGVMTCGFQSAQCLQTGPGSHWGARGRRGGSSRRGHENPRVAVATRKGSESRSCDAVAHLHQVPSQHTRGIAIALQRYVAGNSNT